MELTTTFAAPCAPAQLYLALQDLAGYPSWLSIVTRAVPTDAVEGDRGPVWLVDLRGRIGPLARSKRLRMVRTVAERPGRLRFERREVDGRHHSPWVLDADITAVPDSGDGRPGSRLTMALHYGGSFGGTLLERMLAGEIEDSRPRLLDVVAAS